MEEPPCRIRMEEPPERTPPWWWILHEGACDTWIAFGRCACPALVYEREVRSHTGKSWRAGLRLRV